MKKKIKKNSNGHMTVARGMAMGGEGRGGPAGCRLWSQRSYDRWALGEGGEGQWGGGKGEERRGGGGGGGGGEERGEGPGRGPAGGSTGPSGGPGRGPVKPAQHKSPWLATGLKKIEIRPGPAR